MTDLFYFILGVLDKVIQQCVDGAKILDICVAGDNAIVEATKAVYTKKKFSKGKNKNTYATVASIED